LQSLPPLFVVDEDEVEFDELLFPITLSLAFLSNPPNYADDDKVLPSVKSNINRAVCFIISSFLIQVQITANV
jgi:hypothetical protein